MKKITLLLWFLGAIAFTLLPVLFLAGCQTQAGTGKAEKETYRAIPFSEVRRTVSYTIGPDGKTNSFSFEEVTNTYPANIIGKTYLAERTSTVKKIHARYVIGGGNIQNFSTEAVNALGTVDRTSVGTSTSQIDTNAFKAMTDTIGNVVEKAIEGVKK